MQMVCPNSLQCSNFFFLGSKAKTLRPIWNFIGPFKGTYLEFFPTNFSFIVSASVMFVFEDHATVRKVVRALPAVGIGANYGLLQTR